MSFDGFTVYDFDLFTRDKWRSTNYNAARLAVRRKLAAIAKPLEARWKAAGVPLVHKTSLHNPSRYNSDHVRMIKAYFTRAPAARKALRELFGPALGKDLDPHYHHTQLWIKVDCDGVEFSLAIHPKAWWDAETFRALCKDRQAAGRLVALLRPLPDYHFKLHDWGKLYPCESLYPDDLAELARNYQPAEHWLFCLRRMPAEAIVEEGPAFIDTAHAELERLVPVYDAMIWSPERNLIFGQGR